MHLARLESPWIIPVPVIVSNGRYIGSDAEMNTYSEARTSCHDSFKDSQRNPFTAISLCSRRRHRLLYTYYPFSDRLLTHKHFQS